MEVLRGLQTGSQETLQPLFAAPAAAAPPPPLPAELPAEPASRLQATWAQSGLFASFRFGAILGLQGSELYGV